MELLKFCAVCVIMAISQFESSEGQHYDLVAGDSKMIKCEPKIKVTSLLSGTAHLFMRQPNEVVLYRNINSMAPAKYPPSLYSMKLDTIDSEAVFKVNFTDLKVSDSGLWQCVLETDATVYFKNVTFSVKPAADVGRVELKLVKAGESREVTVVHEEGDADPTTKTVRLLSGTYTMSCAAENGYPLPQYTLFRNGQPIIGSETTATVNLTTADTNLGCTVVVNRKEFSEHSLYFELNIEDVEPEIKCETTTARVNDGKAVMNCTVVAADVTCKKVVWKSGTTNQDFTHGGNKVIGYDLDCRSNGENSVWSSLAVRNLEEKHFDDTYFIKIKDTKAGDFQKEHKLQLMRKPGALNGSVQMASLGSLALVAVVTLMKMVL